MWKFNETVALTHASGMIFYFFFCIIIFDSGAKKTGVKPV